MNSCPSKTISIFQIESNISVTVPSSFTGTISFNYTPGGDINIVAHHTNNMSIREVWQVQSPPELKFEMDTVTFRHCHTCDPSGQPERIRQCIKEILSLQEQVTQGTVSHNLLAEALQKDLILEFSLSGKKEES